MSAIVPIPRVPVSVRPATMSDYPFIDRLQDVHSKALGFMRKAALEGKIKLGEVLIAEDEMRLPIGYCMSSNRYLKRDELGIIYQMNVVPGAQRKLVAATLLKAVFERAPYGCKLFCCWCRQDLDANYFWESMGFIPLAFRSGAAGRSARGRVSTHIFWQRRIREGDATTPYWFPSKTDGGMMREDRLVLPIPPNVHWKSEMPILIGEEVRGQKSEVSGTRRLTASSLTSDLRPLTSPAGPQTPTKRPRGHVQFGPPSDGPEPVVERVKLGKPAKPKREKVKADPKHVAAARELRDRYLEHVNANVAALPAGAGKYDVSRAIQMEQRPVPLLKAS